MNLCEALKLFSCRKFVVTLPSTRIRKVAIVSAKSIHFNVANRHDPVLFLKILALGQKPA